MRGVFGQSPLGAVLALRARMLPCFPHLRSVRSLLTLTLGLCALPAAYGCGNTKQNQADSSADSNAASTDSNSSSVGTSSGGASSGSADNGASNEVSGTTTTDSGGTTSGGTTSTVTTDAGGTGGSAGQAGASSTATDGGSGGQGATCLGPEDCLDSERCDFPDDLCGDGEPGTCVPLPIGASDGVSACGCDGAIYQDVSYVYLYGTDLDLLGRCTDGPAWCDVSGCAFSGWCGGRACSLYWDGAEAPRTYCKVLESDCDTRYECGGWSASDCPQQDCSCFDGALGCSEDDDGFVTVVQNDEAIVCEP